MPTERLRSQDATLWCVQGAETPLQVGALCLFEAGPLTDETGALRLEALRTRVGCGLGPFPRLRQRLVPVPFDQGRPLWVDAADFDLADHVRAAALPRPGTDAQLRELVSRFIEVPLDPRRPLWEILVVEGVGGDRVAVVPKFSHVMADGMAVLEFSLALLSTEPDPEPVRPAPWEPEPGPSSGRTLIDGVVDRTRRGVGALLAGAAVATRPRQMFGRLRQLAGAGASTSGLAPRLSITRPVGPHRDFTWVSLPIDDLVEVKRAMGVTLNDVGLAVVTGASLRRYLERTDQAAAALPGRSPHVLVPVSTHTATPGEIENRFSMMVADLPLSTDDPVERLRLVHAEMVRRKESAQQSVGPLLFGLGDIVPEWVLRGIGPPILRHQPLVNLAVTDLPGTRETLYLLGSRMLALHPYVAVTGNIAVIIGLLSYGDQLGVGITVDADAVTDAGLLAESVEQASRELVEAVRLAGGRRGTVGQRSTGVAAGEHAVGE